MDNRQRRIRLVISMGKTCNAYGEAESLHKRLVAVLGELDDFRSTRTVHWERANCLDRCGEGPNLVFYPQGIWFHHTDLPTLERIIAQFRAHANGP